MTAQHRGQVSDQRGEQGAVGPVQPRPRIGSTKYRDLVAQDEQLDVLGRGRAAEQHQPAEDPVEDQIEEAERHVHDHVWPLRNADHRTSQAQADFWNHTATPPWPSGTGSHRPAGSAQVSRCRAPPNLGPCASRRVAASRPRRSSAAHPRPRVRPEPNDLPWSSRERWQDTRLNALLSPPYSVIRLGGLRADNRGPEGRLSARSRDTSRCPVGRYCEQCGSLGRHQVYAKVLRGVGTGCITLCDACGCVGAATRPHGRHRETVGCPACGAPQRPGGENR